MTSTPPKGDTDELREQVLTEFRQVLKLAPADYTQNCTNVVMSLIESYAAQREIEVLERTQRDFVHGESSEAFDEGRQYEQFLNRQLINELKKQKEEQPDVR